MHDTAPNEAAIDETPILIGIETDADLHGPAAETVLAGLVAYNTAKLPPVTGRLAVTAEDQSGCLRAGISVALFGTVAVSSWGAWSDDTAPGEALLPLLTRRAEIEAARRGATRFVLYVRPGAALPPASAGWTVLARADKHDAGLPYTVLIKDVADGRPVAAPDGYGIVVNEPPSKPLGAELWRRGDAYRQRRLGVPVGWHSAVARRNGKVVAGALCRIVGYDLMLDMMWVDESLRGRNVGRDTLQRAIDSARALGCIRAATESLDCQALDFYRKLGFAPHAYCPIPIEGMGMHFLQMRL